MTLDEAIKHAEEVAKEQEELYRLCPASESMFYCDGTKDCRTLKNGKNKGCRKCAEEHQQLAEWLKDYKRLKEQEACGDAISRQAVLDALDKSKYSNEFCEEHHIDWSINLSMAHIVVNELKSVASQPKIGRWITGKDEYGDVYEAVCSYCDKNGNHK